MQTFQATYINKQGTTVACNIQAHSENEATLLAAERKDCHKALYSTSLY